MKETKCDNEGTARAVLREERVHRTASAREKKCQREDGARVVHAKYAEAASTHISHFSHPAGPRLRDYRFLQSMGNCDPSQSP